MPSGGIASVCILLLIGTVMSAAVEDSTSRLGSEPDAAVMERIERCRQEQAGWGCLRMGLRLLAGGEDDRRQLLARELFKEACLQHVADACRNLGLMRERGIGHPSHAIDLEGAVEAYREACNLGHDPGCRNLGTLYLTGKVSIDRPYQRAAVLFKHACRGKDLEACTNLGSLYAMGMGVERDMSKAVRHFEQSCKRHEWTACVNLGWCRETGDGIERDIVRAGELYRAACTAGNQRGCAHLGRLRNGGRGSSDEVGTQELTFTIEDPVDASRGSSVPESELIRSAGREFPVDPDPSGPEPVAEEKPYVCPCAGSLECARTGFRLLKADPPEPAWAAACFRRSCMDGEGISCSALGFLLLEGRGVIPSVEMACGSFAEACVRGHTRGCDEWRERCRPVD